MQIDKWSRETDKKLLWSEKKMTWSSFASSTTSSKFAFVSYHSVKTNIKKAE
jgi:hypothetical protein